MSNIVEHNAINGSSTLLKNNFLESNLKDVNNTNNIIYSILNGQDPNTLFKYFILLIIFLYIGTVYTLTSGVIIMLILYGILIYYLYTDKYVTTMDNFKILKDKYDIINDNKNSIILKTYPKIIDFLYFINNLKYSSFPLYKSIETQFENFVLLYEACITDITLINLNFSTIEKIKNQMLYTLNAFNFNTNNYVYTVKLYECRKKLENIFNECFNELLTIQNKNIYYNGYNNSLSIIDKSGILPSNYFDDENEFIRSKKNYDVLNYFLL